MLGGKSLWWTRPRQLPVPVTLTTAGSTFRNARRFTPVRRFQSYRRRQQSGGVERTPASSRSQPSAARHTISRGWFQWHEWKRGSESVPTDVEHHFEPARQGRRWLLPLHHHQFPWPGRAGGCHDQPRDLDPPIATVTNTTGTLDFADTNSPSFNFRLYRTVTP